MKKVAILCILISLTYGWSCDWPLVKQSYAEMNINITENTRSIQYLLNSHGISVTVDGVFGELTVDAVKAFQRKNSLDSDGVVGSGTWKKLIVNVDLGSKGFHAKAAQSQLVRWGFFVKIDGFFGTESVETLKLFQKSRQVDDSGVVNELMWLLFVSGCNSSTTAKYGFDLSYYQGLVTLESMKCLKKTGFQFAIFQAKRAAGLNPYVHNDVENARKAGFDHVDVYLFPNRSIDPVEEAQSTIDHVKGLNYERMWLDVEGEWPEDQEANIRYIQQLRETIENNGIKVGMYAGRSWPKYVGKWTGMSDLPLWYAHYDGDPSFQDFSSYGGWTRPDIKQFKGTTEICDTEIDKNWSPKLFS